MTVCLVLFAGIRYIVQRYSVMHEEHETNIFEEAVGPDDADMTEELFVPEDTIQQVESKQIPSVTQKKKAADQIDAATLDDLFKEASEQIL